MEDRADGSRSSARNSRNACMFSNWRRWNCPFIGSSAIRLAPSVTMPVPNDDPFTGLLTQLVRPTPRAHDPAVAITAGEMPPWFPGEPAMGCSGAGWTTDQADQACFGEALERCLARSLPCDHSIQAAWASWPLPEPAIDPVRWALFHDEQYASKGFPFEPLTRETVCQWVCCRRAPTGEPQWVPEEFVFLMHRPGQRPWLTIGLSTGLSCAETADLAILRGAQEVIERDAVVGGWWGSYPLEEWPAEAVIPMVGESRLEPCRSSRPALSLLPHSHALQRPCHADLAVGARS